MGQGFPIPFVEYIAGRGMGLYAPIPKPFLGARQKSLQEEMRDEVRKIFIRRVAEQTLPPIGDPRYATCINDLKKCLYNPYTGQYDIV
jgi:hypothetical protein